MFIWSIQMAAVSTKSNQTALSLTANFTKWTASFFATGFEVGTDYSRRAGYNITGSNGLTISQKWSEGLTTFHGMHVREFPNCFFFGPAQAGFTATYTFSLDENALHLGTYFR